MQDGRSVAEGTGDEDDIDSALSALENHSAPANVDGTLLGVPAPVTVEPKRPTVPSPPRVPAPARANPTPALGVASRVKVPAPARVTPPMGVASAPTAPVAAKVEPPLPAASVHVDDGASRTQLGVALDADRTQIIPSDQQQIPKLAAGTGRPPDAVRTARVGPRMPTPPKPFPAAKPRDAKALEIDDNTQIDRFGLIREIARGGMGQVFLARDTKLGRKVAIKFLLNDDPNFAERFLIEARATARCTHENIVSIYEVGEYRGLPYMVLEYLEGKTLSQVLEGTPSLRVFCEIMLSIARALERAHEHGIVHRDLKPSNIFVTERGQVKVLDFGVARVLDQFADPHDQIATPRITNKFEAVDGSGFPEQNTYVTFSSGGSLVGTFPYMSPEQWGAGTVDHRSDIWACGIMFWRALTNVHPLGTMNADKLRKRMLDADSPVPSIGERNMTLPREVIAIVDKCLAKQVNERYQSATELISDLQAFLTPKAERISEDVCPYRGLSSFGEADAKYFFGRANEIRTGLAQLETWPMLAVIGPSGVGKSSFVNAGLIPSIRNSGGNWQIRILRPGRAPLQSLASTLGDGAGADIPVAEQLRESPGLYGEHLRREARSKKQRILIVVDQLEELFTLSDDDDLRRLFLAAILAAADDASSPVRVVLSMRADFLDRLATHKQFLSELARGLFFLSAPDKDNLRETLIRPAALAGYQFEDPSIVEDMMQSSTSKGALPLVQFTANRMWDARDRERKVLTLAAYEEMGGVGGAFAKHADDTAAMVPPQQQGLLRAIMTRLVTPEGTRAVVDQHELIGLADDPKEAESVLDRLVQSRLVLLQTDTQQGAVVEIVHEVLITKWPTMVRWLEDSQVLRGFLHELRTATKQWIARNRAADLVWRGATAEEALATQKKHVLDLAANERDFLAAAAAERRRALIRKRITIGAILAVLLLLIAGGVLWGIQTQQKNAEVEAANVVARENLAVAQQQRSQIQVQLDEIKAANSRREAAERDRQAAQADKAKADAQVARSKEDVEKANAELLVALESSQKEKVVAIEAAKRAAAAAEVAKKATEAAKAAQTRVEVMLNVEQRRVRELEAEKAKISTQHLVPK